MTLYKKLLSNWLLIIGLLIIGVLSFQLNQAKIMSVINACTWVTTSCGSGCADNKDIYNCSPTVQVQTVAVDTSNPDSNNKAQYVAPAVVTQYIAPVTEDQIKDAGKISGVGSVANAADQKANTTTTFTDDTGLGGSITSSTGPNDNQINAANVSMYSSGVENTSVSGDGYFFCLPNKICAGSVVSGGAPWVVGCDCSGDGKTDRQLAVNTVTDNQAAAYCSQVICSAPGSTVTWGGKTYQKRCEPGAQMCAGGGKAYVCKDDGTGFHTSAVNSHACGYIGCGSGPGYEDCGKTDFCSQGYLSQASQYCLNLGSNVKPEFVDGCYTCNVPTPVLKKGKYTRFVGCDAATGTKNCYAVTDPTTNPWTTVTECYYEPGLSCGVSKVDTIAPPPPATTTENPPASPPPPPPTTPTPPPPAAPQCLSISSSKTAPKIGDQVSFTCNGSPSDLVVRYEFRYAVSGGASTGNQDNQGKQSSGGNQDNKSSSTINFQALSTGQGTPNISVPITVDRVGRYLAQCRPCTANSCLDWEPAELN